MTQIGLGISLTRLGALRSGGFSPATLFALGEVGAWYDPSPDTCFTDTARTTPVTAAGQKVLGMTDGSGNGFHASAVEATAPLYDIDENGTPRLYFPTGAEFMSFPSSVYGTNAPLDMMAAAELHAAGVFPVVFAGNSTSTGVFFGVGNGTTPRIRYALTPTDAILGSGLSLNIPYALSFTYTGQAITGDIDGVRGLSGGRTGVFGQAEEGRIGYSAGSLRSPIYFYGGVIRKTLYSVNEFNSLGNYYSAKTGRPVTEKAALKAYAIGDSTISAYLGQDTVISFIDTARTTDTVANPGNTIAQQLDAWNLRGVRLGEVGWVVIQVGLNDLNPAESASAAITRLQSLVDAVRASDPAGVVLVSEMIRVRSKLIQLYGATDGEISYTKLLAINEAISGGGAQPITNVAGRVSSHIPLLDDGAGSLRVEYQSDLIHPNNAGRAIIADAWADALQSLGVVL